METATEQNKWLKKALKGSISEKTGKWSKWTVAKFRKELKKPEEIEERAKRLKSLESEESIKLEYGNALKLASDQIKNNTVDCIITDPPYPKEFLYCWEDLSEIAARVLKPSGFCVAYSGKLHLPEVI